MQVWYLAQHYAALHRHGVKLLAIFESSEAELLRYIGSLDPPFTLVADPDQQLFVEYGVENSWAGWLRGLPRYLVALLQSRLRRIGGLMASKNHPRLPADFLIAPDQTIQYAYYGRHIADRIPMDTIEHLLQMEPEQANAVTR